MSGFHDYFYYKRTHGHQTDIGTLFLCKMHQQQKPQQFNLECDVYWYTCNNIKPHKICVQAEKVFYCPIFYFMFQLSAFNKNDNGTLIGYLPNVLRYLMQPLLIWDLKLLMKEVYTNRIIKFRWLPLYQKR